MGYKSFFDYSSKRREYYIEIYNNNKYEIVEGTVHVISHQPLKKHYPIERIKIGNKIFEIDFFSNDFYDKTISHGGYLDEGVEAKIWYYGDVILRIDILVQLVQRQ
jgi:hypothetical protein